VAEHSYRPASLDFGTTYYWKVNEVNKVTYPGDVWSFTTEEYAAIDDFESYTDQEGQEIFSAWIDGFSTGLSGSTVGYLTATGGTFGETKIVHGGQQSMPLAYDNTKAPFISEAERTFATAQNWAGNGADSLVLYFRGLAPAFAETAAGSILMNAIGTDIWGNSDQFRYAYKTLNGNGSIVARVDSLVNSNAWAKAGVMIRKSIDAVSVHAFTALTPGNSCSYQRRPTTSAASTSNDWTGAAVAAPYWVRITRTGNVFKAETSPDGKTWTTLGTEQTIAMTDPVLIGLAVTSHDAAIPTSAAFSNVSTTGNVTGAWQVAEIGATQPQGNSIEGLYLAVKDTAGKTKVVQHPDPAATTYMTWQKWAIPLSEFTAAGVKVNAVKSLTIGVGDKAAPKTGGTGTVYIDDIGFGHPAQ
jgi:regulation of enolase protein 1 (concanavalin A-like superfamily)